MHVFKWAGDIPVLFQQWTTTTILDLTLALLAAVCLAAAYELLRNWLSSWDNTHRALGSMPCWERTCLRSARSVMHGINATVGYLQMLFAMTFDMRIFLAIILGSGLGFFLMGPFIQRRLIRKECVRLQQDTGGSDDVIKETAVFLKVSDQRPGDQCQNGSMSEWVSVRTDQRQDGSVFGCPELRYFPIDRETTI